MTVMATQPSPPLFLTPDEYLEFDEKAELRSEYFHGRMFEVEGATRNHSLIVTSFGGELYIAMRRASECRMYISTLRVHAPLANLYAYPDIVLTCGPETFGKHDTLINASALIEVLSPSTEDYDRGGKFEMYRSIPSLCEYLTVAQDRVKVDHWTIVAGKWTLTEYKELSETLLVLGKFEVPLREIYAKVEWPS